MPKIANSKLQLTHINITNTGCDNRAATALAIMLTEITTLQSLSIQRNAIQLRGLQAILHSLSTAKTIQQLYLSNIGLDDLQDWTTAVAPTITGLQQLQLLHVHDCQLTNTTTTALAQNLTMLTRITELDLRDNLIGQTGARAIAQSVQALHHLTTLNLSGNQGIGAQQAAALLD